MKVVYSAEHRLHAPVHDITVGMAEPNVEVPARVDCILEALTRDGRFELSAPSTHGVGPIEAVHSVEMVRYLEDAWSEAQLVELFPDTTLHPGLRLGMGSEAREPRAPLGRIGYWCFDTGTPILEHTYSAARASVDIALSAVDLVLGGERVAYGLCRPPGHHAGHAVFGGFCYFNNAAVAAEAIVRAGAGRVAILDIDYHHGNGTQQIFYRRPEVLYVSLHADPSYAYPFYTGYSDETGSGPGLGANCNIPLRSGTDNVTYLEAIERGLEVLARIAPEVTVVSLGIDTYRLDPLGDFTLTTAVYRACAEQVRAVTQRIVVLQEGGYFLQDLGENVRQFLSGLGTRPKTDQPAR